MYCITWNKPTSQLMYCITWNKPTSLLMYCITWNKPTSLLMYCITWNKPTSLLELHNNFIDSKCYAELCKLPYLSGCVFKYNETIAMIGRELKTILTAIKSVLGIPEKARCKTDCLGS
ncbi:hypothetical protein EB796_010935 [Bugula neritina]|uniref:Uncharacterized protein n=1 Tax=Bugula neritina TaxID=10212 RepID=A0A7J7JYF7_BUGNE|nr:hypothetical protein EB796_010935 [Bugula neritina]